MHDITPSLAFRTSADGDEGRYYYTTQGRKRSTAFITLWGAPYGMVNLHQVRKALDEVTIQEGLLLDADPEGKVVKVNLRDRWGNDDGRTLAFSLHRSGKIQVLAPCGEKRLLAVRTLDRVLTSNGF